MNDVCSVCSNRFKLLLGDDYCKKCVVPKAIEKAEVCDVRNCQIHNRNRLIAFMTECVVNDGEWWLDYWNTDYQKYEILPSVIADATKHREWGRWAKYHE